MKKPSTHFIVSE